MKKLMIKLMSTTALLATIFGGRDALGQEFKFKVKHDHLIGSCKGELIINQQGVEYRTEENDHARKWDFNEVKMIKLESPTDIEITSYETSGKPLGGDREFDFKVVDGEITKDVSEFLLARVERPLSTSFVATQERPRYEIPVRHRHRLGGCEGRLKIYSDRLIYESEKAENSRYWRWADIKSISRTNAYEFGVTTYEPEFGGPTKAFNFDLKQEMDETVYDYLWAKVYKVRLPASVKQEQLAERGRP